MTLNSKLRQKMEDRIKNHIDSNEYEVEILGTEKPYKVRVKHMICNKEVIRDYSNFTRSKFSCDCIKKKEKMDEIQNRIDEHFGKDRFTLLDLGNVKRKESKIKILKCGHEIEGVKISSFLNNNKNYGCPICDKQASQRLTRSDIDAFLKDRFKNKIIYVSGYESSTSICKFRFTKCGHEFDMSWSNVVRRKNFNNLVCEECFSSDERNRNEISRNILPIYSVGDRDEIGYEIKCSICGTKQPSKRPSRVTNQSLTAKCECERNIQKEIIYNLLDIEFEGKTQSLSKYLSIEKLKEIQLNKKISYKISKSLYSELTDIYSKYHTSLRNISKLNLPHNKMEIDLSNNSSIYVKNKDTNFFVTKIFAEKVDYFGIDNIIYVEYKTSKSEYSLIFYSRKDKPITLVYSDDKSKNGFNWVGLRYEANKVANLAINIIQYLTNLNNNSKIVKESYQSDNKSYDSFKYDNSVGVTEFKTLYKDTKKKYVYIRSNDIKKRTIRASFSVAGHYRHYIKTGKKIFIAPFEKGKQYRFIRRIEKEYRIK